MRILISGFEPFGGHLTNPTALLVESLQNKELQHPSHLIIDQVLLPVSFERSYETLQEKIKDFNPDVILSFGLAHAREMIELEAVAKNVIDADINDNDGSQPQDLKINSSGPEFLPSTLPIESLIKELNTAGIKAQISQSAGSYVCNYLFYRLMEDELNHKRSCGFIHVPSENNLSLADLEKALEIMLKRLSF